MNKIVLLQFWEGNLLLLQIFLPKSRDYVAFNREVFLVQTVATPFFQAIVVVVVVMSFGKNEIP